MALKQTVLTTATELFPKAEGKSSPPREGATIDIQKEILDTFHASKDQAKAFAPALRGRNNTDTCRNVWTFVNTYIRYRIDPPGEQFVKTPARTFADKFGDCKSMSILAASLLYHLDIPAAFRFSSYRTGDFTHVYVIAYPNGLDGRQCAIDAVLNCFDTEKPYLKKQDVMTTIRRLSGIGAAPDVSDAFSDVYGIDGVYGLDGLDGIEGSEAVALIQGVDAIDALAAEVAAVGDISEARFDLACIKSQLQSKQKEAAIKQGLTSNASLAYIGAMDYVSDMMEAVGNPVKIDALEGEYLSGAYDYTRPVGEIGFLPILAAFGIKKLLARRKRRKRGQTSSATRTIALTKMQRDLLRRRRMSARRLTGIIGEIQGIYGVGDVGEMGEIADIGAAIGVNQIRNEAKLLRDERTRFVCQCARNGGSTNATVKEEIRKQIEKASPALKGYIGEIANNYPVSDVLSGAIGAEGVGFVSPAHLAGIDGAIAGVDGFDGIHEIGNIFKRIGRGLKKFGKGIANVAKKVGKGILKVATLPLRLAAKGIIEILGKTKAGAYFLYTFLTDAQAQKLGPKVVQKRNKQLKIKGFIVNAIGMKEARFNRLVRSGVQKSYGKTPEAVIAELLKRRGIRGLYGIESIGALPLIAAAVPLIQKIMGLLSKLFGGGKGEDPKGGEANPDADVPASDGGAANEVSKEVARQTPDGGYVPSGGGGGGGFSPGGGGGPDMRESTAQPPDGAAAAPTEPTEPAPDMRDATAEQPAAGGGNTMLYLGGAAVVGLALFMNKKGRR